MSDDLRKVHEASLKIYLTLMEEVKIRLGIINFTYHNNVGLPSAMVREICYLQFRLICEIIALGCLVIHDDIPLSEIQKNEYNPTKIIKRLEDAKPHFYPQPIEVKKEGTVLSTIGRNDKVHLSKKELVSLWVKTGNILHKGAMVKLLEPKKDNPHDFKDIFEWSEKLTSLLDCHWITLVENKKGIEISLSVLPNGKARGVVLEFDNDNKEVFAWTLNVG